MSARWIAMGVLLLVGVRLLVAEDPKIRPLRVSPSVLKEALETQKPVSAASAPSLGRTIQDMQSLAIDLEKSGLDRESNRLRAIIHNLTRLAERRYLEKREQLEKMQSEMEELRWAADRGVSSKEPGLNPSDKNH